MLSPLRSTSRRSWPANSLTCGSSSSGKALQRGIASPSSPRTTLRTTLDFPPAPAVPAPRMTPSLNPGPGAGPKLSPEPRSGLPIGMRPVRMSVPWKGACGSISGGTARHCTPPQRACGPVSHRHPGFPDGMTGPHAGHPAPPQMPTLALPLSGPVPHPRTCQHIDTTTTHAQSRESNENSCASHTSAGTSALLCLVGAAGLV